MGFVPFDFDLALALALVLEVEPFGLSPFGGLVPGEDLSDLQAEAEGGQNGSKQTKTMVTPIYHIYDFYMQIFES